MNSLLPRLRQMLEFDEERARANSLHWKIGHYAAGAEYENHRIKPLLTRLVDVAEKAEGIIWINECRCHEAYVGRGMHEPNALCGEMYELVLAIQALRDEVEG